jgi:glucosamine-6-phosphate deaminase
MTLRIIPTQHKADMGKEAAVLIASQVTEKPGCVLGLATGETPREAYAYLIDAHNAGELDFSKVKTFNLDEYVGLDPRHDQSYHWYMQDALFDHINILPQNTHVPNGIAVDIEKACKEYDEMIAEAGGIDLQLLGIGVNGHIAFNEPSDHFAKWTHRVRLTPSTIEVNSQYFASPQDMPTTAITMGIKSIFQARKIVLVASGSNKAKIIHRAFFGPITPEVPASILQLHPDVTLIADDEAMQIIREME